MEDFIIYLVNMYDWKSTMPHGICLIQHWWLIVGLAVTHIITWFSYFGIGYHLYKASRHPNPNIVNNMVTYLKVFKGGVELYASFIFLCGLSHFTAFIVLFVGDFYFYQFLVNSLTAIVSFIALLATCHIRKKVVNYGLE